LMLQSSDPCWVKDDLAIIQWIYTCISTKLFNLVSDDDAIAAELWALFNSSSRTTAMLV
jgi:hypothetical protein